MEAESFEGEEMSKDDGGPALMGFELRDGVVRLTSQMTIRDYFAAAALPTLINIADRNKDLPAMIPQVAYNIADAMLAERAK
jgi:hypothetical protein